MSDVTRGEKLCGFISEANRRPLPDEVLDTARQALVDHVGVVIAGHNFEAVIPARRVAERWGAKGNAQIVLGGNTLPAIAAFVNGSAAHAMDLDDTHSAGCGHPSGPCWSTALSVSQQFGLDEKRAMVAFVTGYEVMARLGGGGTHGIGRNLQARGFHPTSVTGRFGAAAAASVLLGLDARQVGCALGCAATTAGGLMGSFGTHGKAFHAGKAAMDGILAAELAAEGFVGATHLFELEGGWLSAFLRDDKFDIGELDFVDKWEILETGYKRFASCRGTHGSAEAAIAARPLVGDRSIRRVVAYVDPTCVVTAGNLPFPKTPLQGRFSIPFCIAKGLAGQGLGPSDFSDEALHDPGIVDLLHKIELVNVEDMPEDEAHMEVFLEDGSVVKTKVEIPFGDPRRPFTWDDHCSKFHELAEPVLGISKTDILFDLLRNFDLVTGSMEKMKKILSRS